MSIWLAAGLRTPFVRVDGPFAARDSLTLSVADLPRARLVDFEMASADYAVRSLPFESTMTIATSGCRRRNCSARSSAAASVENVSKAVPSRPNVQCLPIC